MGQDEDKQKEVSASTIRREAFFLEFAEAIRVKFPKVPLMVTGGFRTRLGMEQALRDGSCDMIGLGRPGILQPDLPKTIIFNESIADEDAKLEAPPYSSSVFSHGLAKALGIKGLPGASESVSDPRLTLVSVNANYYDQGMVCYPTPQDTVQILDLRWHPITTCPDFVILPHRRNLLLLLWGTLRLLYLIIRRLCLILFPSSDRL